MNDKITLSQNDARKLFWDVLTSNILFIVIDLWLLVVVAPWLWLQIVIGFFILSAFFHIFQVKKVLIKGKLFRLPKRKVKKDDGSKRS